MVRLLQTAEDNRLNCSECGEKIVKGEKYFRRQFLAYKNNSRINLCKRCIARMAIENNIEDKEVSEIKKEMIVETLEENNK
jgi:hypothetical protein